MSATTHREPQVPGQPGAAGVVPRAASHIEGFAVRTPLQPNTRLSELGAQVLLKREDLQPVRSYKIRGAVNLIRGLSDQERAQGVVCASDGNHAQGEALASGELP